MKIIEFKHEVDVIDFVPKIKFVGEFSPEYLQNIFTLYGESTAHELLGKAFCDDFLRWKETN